MSFIEELYLSGYLPSENDRPQTIEYAKACQKHSSMKRRLSLSSEKALWMPIIP